MKILSAIFLFALVSCATQTSQRTPSSAEQTQKEEFKHQKFQGVFDKQD